MDDFLNKTLENSAKKLSKQNTKALNTMKQKVRKNNKIYEKQMQKFRDEGKSLDDEDILAFEDEGKEEWKDAELERTVEVFEHCCSCKFTMPHGHCLDKKKGENGDLLMRGSLSEQILPTRCQSNLIFQK